MSGRGGAAELRVLLDAADAANEAVIAAQSVLPRRDRLRLEVDFAQARRAARDAVADARSHELVQRRQREQASGTGTGRPQRCKRSRAFAAVSACYVSFRRKHTGEDNTGRSFGEDQSR